MGATPSTERTYSEIRDRVLSGRLLPGAPLVEVDLVHPAVSRWRQGVLAKLVRCGRARGLLETSLIHQMKNEGVPPSIAAELEC